MGERRRGGCVPGLDCLRPAQRRTFAPGETAVAAVLIKQEIAVVLPGELRSVAPSTIVERVLAMTED